ncbi:NUDIX domain-containing protein [Rhodobacteraceae bacterium CCMM004]|nr:NUDIX domain-containing protein [Rhodobacteraceae bacterium CCMM004]
MPPEVRTDVFLFGTLRDPSLLATVLGRTPEAEAGALDGHAVRQAADGDWPVLVAATDARAEGLWLLGLAPGDLARLSFYEAGFDYAPQPVEEGSAALLYRPRDPERASARPWHLGDWQERWGALTREAADEAMTWFGEIGGDALARIMPQIRVRADARLRARATPGPATLRSAHGPEAVETLSRDRPYSAFFEVELRRLRHATFDGGMGPEVERGGFRMADAACVLPYDPARQRVLLVEQFRVGPLMRGDPNPWTLEPVAGRIDPGETPEDTARREAREEAGLEIVQLLPCARFYPVPGAVNEFVYAFVGLCDLPDGAGGLHGAVEEAEDIRTHVVALPRLWELIDTGEIATGPLILIAYWLERARRDGRIA